MTSHEVAKKLILDKTAKPSIRRKMRTAVQRMRENESNRCHFHTRGLDVKTVPPAAPVASFAYKHNINPWFNNSL